MRERKPQNSALLIATLGVYLGLVLAGAAPQVLANAALTKQFDVRDEIEFNEDLDTKPDSVCDHVSEQLPGSVDARVSDSISKFLAQFQPAAPLDRVIAIRPASISIAAISERRVPASRAGYVSALQTLIPKTSFARGSLPLPFAYA